MSPGKKGRPPKLHLATTTSQTGASSSSPYNYKEEEEEGYMPSLTHKTAARNNNDAEDAAAADSSSTAQQHQQQKQMLLHPEQEKRADEEDSSRCFRLWRLTAIQKSEGERFAGETAILKGILLILGLLFMVTTTAFIITACALGLDMDGYDRWAANHSQAYKTEDSAAASAMQRLEDLYKNTSIAGWD